MNSAPINNTDIQRIYVAVGRTFRFLLDVKLSPAPALNSVNNGGLFSYLRNVATDSNFALSVLQILIQDRRVAHRNQHNKDKLVCNFKVDDVVKAHVQVKYTAKKGVVSKLSYKAKGSFFITSDLGNNSFKVQPYDKPNSAPRKYKNTELYLLPPALFPSHPLNTINQQHMDSAHAPIVNPLKNL